MGSIETPLAQPGRKQNPSLAGGGPGCGGCRGWGHCGRLRGTPGALKAPAQAKIGSAPRAAAPETPCPLAHSCAPLVLLPGFRAPPLFFPAPQSSAVPKISLCALGWGWEMGSGTLWLGLMEFGVRGDVPGGCPSCSPSQGGQGVTQAPVSPPRSCSVPPGSGLVPLLSHGAEGQSGSHWEPS